MGIALDVGKSQYEFYGWNAGPISIFMYKQKEYCDQTIFSNECPKIYVKK